MLRTGPMLALFCTVAVALTEAPIAPAGPAMVPVGALRVASHEVTVAEWRVCVAAGACDKAPVAAARNPQMPVTNVNAFDVAAYVTWIKGTTGRHLRLPTAAEWRAFSGTTPKPKRPLRFSDPRLAWAARYGQETTPTGPVRPSGAWGRAPTGVHDVEGNVWEWTSSCIDGTVQVDPATRCPAFIAAGAHEALVSVFARGPANGGCVSGTPPTHLGFRLVEDQR